MSVRERDPLTGHATTGHEWDGITELNTRVPRAIWWFIGITHLWALIYWILMPSWPLVTTYTKGLLGYDEQEQVERQVVEAQFERSAWSRAIEEMPIEQVRADPALMRVVDETAPALFGDNCAVCHGADAAGGPGFPSLVDDAWLWGGDADTILETLRVGINAGHPDTRTAQMLAFGRDGVLTRDDIRTLVGYVRSLSGADAPEEVRAAGAQLFADNCASCHGGDGGGSTELGAPDLTDAFWIYGGGDAAIFETIFHGRQGWMPAWENRMGLAERKILTIYIQDLPGVHPR
jgi:cytochrome c oxidase cbb3-type subunit III